MSAIKLAIEMLIATMATALGVLAYLAISLYQLLLYLLRRFGDALPFRKTH